MNVVPEDLADLVRRAALATPPHVGDLANVRRRARARRRRRAAATAGGLVVLVALTGGAVPLLAGSRPARPATTAPAPASPVPAPPPSTNRPAEPAQRLMIAVDPNTWRLDRGRGPEVGLRGGGEVLPDGSVRRHRTPKDFGLGAALPDGRLVGLLYTDLMPGVRRTDGPNVEGLSIKLVVLGPDDAVEISREVRIKGRSVELLGADQRYAYLARDEGIVAHELTTGRERTLLRSSTAGVDLMAASQTAVGSDRLAEQRTDSPCRTDVRRLADGKRIARLTADGICMNGLRLSPDGRLVAVPYFLPDHGGQQRVAVYETGTGNLRVDQAIGTPRRIPVPGGIQGLAWADDTLLRVAWAELPAGARRVYSVEEVLKVVTVTVQ
ncbi:hypothetical protein OG799_31575 [Micromonospora sp. NBC_00898]|uniref:hypothetical protein n=1 Tax=Micromonospora sp. NBC_00898 TaxID=2975981 RepID=UPI00386EF509|nr:hypothetical protein OG799_31575 [Micromonospora sp. NBC_00898]